MVRRFMALSVASFNTHAGIDGWGRPFDLVEQCRAIDADVLVLQEVWRPDGSPDAATEIGQALGYSVRWHPLCSGRRARPHPSPTSGWQRPGAYLASTNGLFMDGNRPLPSSQTASARFQEAELGTIGMAILSRLPTERTGLLDLGRLPRDALTRVALTVTVPFGAYSLTVAGTHMSHLTKGSVRQFARLRQALEPIADSGPAVLAGDMNLWGPPLVRLFPGWKRAVRQRTWPSWRPHSQLDHILVRGPIEVVTARVLPDAGSDHRPVRVELAPA